MEVMAFSGSLMDGKILNIPFGYDSEVGPRGAEGHYSEIHQKPAAMSRQEWPGQEGSCGQGEWMALRIQEVKDTGPGEGVDLGAEGEEGGQASGWGEWRSGQAAN